MKNFIAKHWPAIITCSLAALLLLWAGGCPPRVRSPIDPSRRLTRVELTAELNYTIELFEAAELDLDEQERIRKLILQNAMAIASTGSVNPLAIITAIAGIYGVTRAGTDTVSAVKKRKKNGTTST